MASSAEKRRASDKSEKAAGAKFSEDRRLALMLLSHYYLARGVEIDENHKTKQAPTRTDWFSVLRARKFECLAGKTWSEEEGDPAAKKSFDNFLRTGSPKSSEYVYEYLRPHMIDPRFYPTAPKPVKKAIEVAFEHDVEPHPFRDGNALSETIRKITEQGQPFAKRLVDGYMGIWDVVRYSAHGDQDHRPSRDPKIMRAVMKISEPTTKDVAAEFEILYQPHSLENTSQARSCRGAVLVLGRGEHLMFSGWEDRDTKPPYPIEIFALPGEAHKGDVSLFFGLVVRRHEYGPIFASRVMFLRSKASSIESQRKKIGMFERSKLLTAMKKDHKHIANFNALLEIIVNKVGAEGRSGLWLANTTSIGRPNSAPETGGQRRQPRPSRRKGA